VPLNKSKESACASRVSPYKNNNNNKGGSYYQLDDCTSALYCSKRTEISRWPLAAEQCSGVYPLGLKTTKRNQLAETEKITTAGAVTHAHSPARQRCTAAKDGKFQGCL
jgi:hypothetical protein